MMVDKTLMWNAPWLSRFAVALGGFLIWVGCIIIGVFLIGFFDIIDFVILEESLQSLPSLLLLAIGLVDLVAGIILWRR